MIFIIKPLHGLSKTACFDLAINHAFEIKNYEKSIRLLGEIVESLWEKGQAFGNYEIWR